MPSPRPLEIIVILLIILLLFGAKKLPDLSRSIGRSLRIFKSEIKELRDDDEDVAVPPAKPREVEGRVVDGPTLNGEPTRVTEGERER